MQLSWLLLGGIDWALASTIDDAQLKQVTREYEKRRGELRRSRRWRNAAVKGSWRRRRKLQRMAPKRKAAGAESGGWRLGGPASASIGRHGGGGARGGGD